MWRGPHRADAAGMTNPIHQQTTAAYYAQAVLSFGVSLTAMVLGVAYLPVGPWVRAFLGLGVLYVVTSAFTLAKCVRDRQEIGQVTSRVDQARLDKLLAEHDPFKVEGM
jgi:hypothetical protein